MKQYIALTTKILNSWKYRWFVLYSSIILATGLSYTSAYHIIIDQSSSFITIISNITLNLILLFFMWGIVSDKMFGKYSSRTRWILWGIGLLLLILFFKFVGGYETKWF